MIDYTKTPLKHIDARLSWWQNFSESLLKAATYLEDELSLTFRDDKLNEEPDPDAPLVHYFVKSLYDLYSSSKNHEQYLQAASDQHERFCRYWQHGEGEWNGLHEFLREEVNPYD